MAECQLPVFPAYKRTPAHKKPNRKNEESPFKYFLQEDGIARGFHFGHYKGQGIAYGEKKKRKNQVGRRAAMPGRMLQRSVDMCPAAGVVYKYHQRYSSAAEDIERIKTLIHGFKVRQIGLRAYSQKEKMPAFTCLLKRQAAVLQCMAMPILAEPAPCNLHFKQAAGR